MIDIEIDITEDSIEYQKLCDLLNSFNVEWWINDPYDTCNKTRKEKKQ